MDDAISFLKKYEDFLARQLNLFDVFFFGGGGGWGYGEWNMGLYVNLTSKIG